MSQGPSLVGRATAAIALMIGFYLLALAIAGGLLYLPWAEMKHLGRLHIKLAIGCVVGAGVILWAIVPRWDRFEAPGPRLEADSNPRLFSELRRLATATSQAMPTEVYLVPEVNAWVTQRGGVMGFGSRRVMGLGLPLLQALDVAQLRAVLVHELGHFHGGDVQLGPWIYKTRAAIGRTVQRLGEAESFLQAPFRWYGMLFLRLTHAISRTQEYAADALAARVVGARAMAGALTRIRAASLAYDAYWHQELAPAFDHGLQPPVADGFARFQAAPSVAEAISKAVDEAVRSGEADPYDTHPALRERLAALEGMPPGRPEGEAHAALTLLGDARREENRLFAFLSQQPGFPALKPASWEDVGKQVWLKVWREDGERNARALMGVTTTELPALAVDPSPLFSHLGQHDVEKLDAEAAAQRARGAIGSALACRLVDEGWSLSCLPGEAVALRQEQSEVRPFEAVERLASGELAAADWESTCTRAGIRGLALAAPNRS